MVHEPNLHQLRIFAAVARLGSFSRAAKELTISQPAVSVQVQELERTLGTPLLQRLGRKIVPTEAGEIVLEHTQQIFQIVEVLSTSVNDIRGLYRGTIRVGASLTVAETLLPPLLALFGASHPSVNVEVEVCPVESMGGRLSSGTLSLCFAADPPMDELVTAVPIATDEIVVICDINHRFRDRRNIPIPALRSERWVAGQVNDELRQISSHFALKRGLDLDVVQSHHSLEGVKRSVIAGAGLAFVQRTSVTYEIAARALAVLDVPDLTFRRTIAVLHHRQRRLSRAEQALVDLARQTEANLLLPVTASAS